MMKTPYIRNIKIVVAMISIFVILICIQNCSRRQHDPSRLKRYYVENYPSSKKLDKKSPKSEEPVAFWQDESENGALDLTKIQNSDVDLENDNDFEEKTDINDSPSSVDEVVQGQLEEHPDYQYAANDTVVGQNTSSMIEGKIFKLIEKAYARRDYDEFLRLYSFFLESFPHSSQKGLLDEKRDSFFYHEELHKDELQGSLVDISYPDAKTWNELNRYFEKLKESGVEMIQVNVVQYLSTPVYLFATEKKLQGYYFSGHNGVLIEDLLTRMASTAHDKGLKILASFPLRHHPQLSSKPEFLMDESWNEFQNRTTPNLKLDLLNPQSQIYLQELIDALMSVNIDGIVFRDDFTYEINEGFSEMAQFRYTKHTGRPIVFNQMFLPVNKKHHAILTSDDFDDVALWRTREIKQLLWELTSSIKDARHDFMVGIEATPEMLLDNPNSVKWYSTGLSFLRDLKVDFYILKWRKFNSDIESDPEVYRAAALGLRQAISEKTDIYLKVPLGDYTKNIIRLNRKLASHTEIKKEMEGVKLAIGPVDRLKNFEFLN